MYQIHGHYTHHTTQHNKKARFLEDQRIGGTVSKSFLPPEFLPTETYKPAYV
jgi:hypothetical protein